MAFEQGDGNVLPAADVNRLFARALMDHVQNRYAIIKDSDVTEFSPTTRDMFIGGFEELITTPSNFDLAGSTGDIYHDTLIGVVCADSFDEMSGTVSDKWTTGGSGSVSYGGGDLVLSLANEEDATAYSDGTVTDLDAKLNNGTVLIHNVRITGTLNTAGNRAEIEITDGAVDVLVRNVLAETGSSYELFFDVSGQTVKHRRWTGGIPGSWSSTISLAGLSTNWYIKFTADTFGAGADTGTMLIEAVRLVAGSAITGTFQSNSYDHLSRSDANFVDVAIACDLGMFTINRNFQGGSATYQISTDNGSNYSTVTEHAIDTIANPGGQVLFKANLTTAIDRPMFLFEFGVQGLDLDYVG